MYKKKIYTEKKLISIIDEWKTFGKIVFTNGCFDIIHLGHIDYLEKSKLLGYKLIVGINSDSSVKKLKGLKRPIIDEISRASIIASLEVVDAVIIFDEETPYNLISKIKPNVLVKGGDYNLSQIVGSDIVISNGGKIETIKYLSGYSTTKIISKIKNIT